MFLDLRNCEFILFAINHFQYIHNFRGYPKRMRWLLETEYNDPKIKIGFFKTWIKVSEGIPNRNKGATKGRKEGKKRI